MSNEVNLDGKGEREGKRDGGAHHHHLGIKVTTSISNILLLLPISPARFAKPENFRSSSLDAKNGETARSPGSEFASLSLVDT